MDNLLLKKVNAFLSHTWNCCLSADLEQPDILFHFTLCLPSNFFLLLFLSILSYQACSNSRNVYLVEIQPSHEALHSWRHISPPVLYTGDICHWQVSFSLPGFVLLHIRFTEVALALPCLCILENSCL